MSRIPGESIIFVLFCISNKEDIEVVWTPWLLDKAFTLSSLPISLDVSVDLPAPELPTKRIHLFFIKLISYLILLPYLAEQSMISILICL